MRWVDLHVHSTFSDGTSTPTELIREAKEAGLSGIALTDHDTTNGIREAAAAAKEAGLMLVPGIEISVEYKGHDIHMLGLGIDLDSRELEETLFAYTGNRDLRNAQMLALLRDAGYTITQELLAETYPDSILTRAHIARYLRDSGQIPDMAYAFEHLIGDDGSCYVKKIKPDPAQAIGMIIKAGGKAVIAHPNLYHMTEAEQDAMIAEFTGYGLFGVEAIYSMNDDAQERQSRRLAAKYGLAITGGSDHHGTNKPHIRIGVGRGGLRVPEELIYPFLREE